MSFQQQAGEGFYDHVFFSPLVLISSLFRPWKDNPGCTESKLTASDSLVMRWFGPMAISVSFVLWRLLSKLALGKVSSAAGIYIYFYVFMQSEKEKNSIKDTHFNISQ